MPDKDEPKTKASRKYDVPKMSYDLLGKTFTVILKPVALPLAEGETEQRVAFILNDSQLRSVLIGYSNMVVDSIASLTLKGGFTEEQRLARMIETHDSIDEGVYAKERAERTTVAKQVADKLTDLIPIGVELSKGNYDKVTFEQAKAYGKYDADAFTGYCKALGLDPETGKEIEEAKND